jgi:hypothetical protein
MLSSVAAVGCLQEGLEEEEDPIGAVDEVPTFELTESSDDRLAGSLLVEGTQLAFDVTQTEHQNFAIEVRYDDNTLTAVSDYTRDEFVFDGVKSDGSDVELSKFDLYVVGQLGQAIADAQLPKAYRPDVERMRGVVYQTPSSALKRALAVWAQRTIGTSADHVVKSIGVDYLCGYLTSWYIPASHDCWDCDHDDWSLVEVGPGGLFNCYPDDCHPLCANYNGGSCSEQQCKGGGISVVQWGSIWDKYGACTNWDTNAYTKDCLDHDHCVRNGHGTGSYWCMDEGAAAADDQAQASDCIMNNGCADNCGSYSSSGGCFCDSACDDLGDCCMDYHIQCGA